MAFPNPWLSDHPPTPPSTTKKKQPKRISYTVRADKERESRDAARIPVTGIAVIGNLLDFMGNSHRFPVSELAVCETRLE